jgi:hypothetical protein
LIVTPRDIFANAADQDRLFDTPKSDARVEPRPRLDLIGRRLQRMHTSAGRVIFLIASIKVVDSSVGISYSVFW